VAASAASPRWDGKALLFLTSKCTDSILANHRILSALLLRHEASGSTKLRQKPIHEHHVSMDNSTTKGASLPYPLQGPPTPRTQTLSSSTIYCFSGHGAYLVKKPTEHGNKTDGRTDIRDPTHHPLRFPQPPFFAHGRTDRTYNHRYPLRFWAFLDRPGPTEPRLAILLS
jgi:hypothetical protein